jgi:hypothetical protein
VPQHTRVDVLPIQEVVASASPSAWRDGLVVEQGAAPVTIPLRARARHALTTRATPQPGEPVAVHPVAGLLAVGGVWYAARPSV